MPSAAASFVTEMAMAHVPVLTQELIRLLDAQTDSRVVDCTFGAGGHAEAVGTLLRPEGLLVGCDRDPVAEEYYQALARRLQCQTRFCRGDFADSLATLLHEREHIDHIYMDLGVSSMQIDTPERGFSYSYDAPLDMRMDPTLGLTAADILNTWSETALAEVFSRYGEERYSRRIARAIVARRAKQPYTHTCELVDTIKHAIPTPARFAAGNPARRVFQALRIEVNGELESLARALPLAFDLLQSGGVMAVISFHSLEDRMVKDFFTGKAKPCVCPPDFPVCACGGKATGVVMTPKAVVPGPGELEMNPRAASAKLRALRKL
jgi:16S rRNA (cytosine1402-N4)-methyltransferase